MPKDTDIQRVCFFKIHRDEHFSCPLGTHCTSMYDSTQASYTRTCVADNPDMQGEC